MSLQMVFSADAHLAEGHLLCQKKAVNKGKSLKFRNKCQFQQFQARKDKIKTIINVNKGNRV
jgi:hypothetical protein